MNIEAIKKIRELTSASISEIKKALEASKGDEKTAIDILKKKGSEIIGKKNARSAREGIIDVYIHADGKIGVMVELLCETDFVARNSDFKSLAHDLAMHIAAFAPKDIEELKGQEFLKNSSLSVKDAIGEAIAKFGENIILNRFCYLNLKND
ncbi:MAG: translation elongation factor Ts [Parcubacteria group bacterium]|nr:translation elongation factor Ts [Parcubacteria group bacterium]